jgi:hypothetical protein
MALVNVADLTNYMSNISLNATQTAVAQQVLDGTQQELETYLGRPVQPVQVRERRMANRAGDLVLSVTPVFQVLSLRRVTSTDFVTLDEPDITPLTVTDVDRLWDAMPVSTMIVPGGVYVGTPGVFWNIEYVGGYNGYQDAALRLKILEVASRTMTVDHDDTLTIKDDIAREPSRAASMEKGWTEEELVRYDRLRRRTALR